jgi:hypothetical protein
LHKFELQKVIEHNVYVIKVGEKITDAFTHNEGHNEIIALRNRL